jgi:hypothetical protein
MFLIPLSLKIYSDFCPFTDLGQDLLTRNSHSGKCRIHLFNAAGSEFFPLLKEKNRLTDTDTLLGSAVNDHKFISPIYHDNFTPESVFFSDGRDHHLGQKDLVIILKTVLSRLKTGLEVLDLGLHLIDLSPVIGLTGPEFFLPSLGRPQRLSHILVLPLQPGEGLLLIGDDILHFLRFFRGHARGQSPSLTADPIFFLRNLGFRRRRHFLYCRGTKMESQKNYRREPGDQNEDLPPRGPAPLRRERPAKVGDLRLNGIRRRILVLMNDPLLESDPLFDRSEIKPETGTASALKERRLGRLFE